jgi:hypothetical protein
MRQQPTPARPTSALSESHNLPAPRGVAAVPGGIVAAGISAAAFLVYFFSLAPGLTWSHQGADGGELIAAAVVNGVPHPPGYPLYTLLLQGWLALTGLLWPLADLNWRGALFSALCAALSAGVTFLVLRHLLRGQPYPLLWAALAALAWAVAPLLWMQAVITEVYALHALLLALLGWAVLVHTEKLWYVVLPVALGVANHLTFVLLLPAAFYYLWSVRRARQGAWWQAAGSVAGVFVLGLGLGALLYGRTPLAAAGAPPVNWGYADTWDGFWWLVSGAAYRAYLFAAPAGSLGARFGGWAYTVTAQYTPFGLALALVGLAHWDSTAARLRNFSLLWLAPISAYALAYYTRDSDIYLLPVGWVMALWLGVGLAVSAAWLQRRQAARRAPRASSHATGSLLLAGFVALALVGITAWRWPGISLAHDTAAQEYLQQVADVLEPQSILVTLDDRETFAVWYGTWGSGELAAGARGLVPINESLYQFAWYRRLQSDLYRDIQGIGESVDAVIAENRGKRPIFFAQLPTYIDPAELTQVGPLWRLNE